MLGMGYLQTTASAVLADGTQLTQFYGYTADAPATGGCQPAHTWEKAYCYSIITLASTNSGLDWHSRAPIHWDGAVAGMPAMVEGPCEPSLVALPDGKTILSVFRLQSNKNLWMAKSTDGARSWETAQETNAWAVFPQVRSLPNPVVAPGRARVRVRAAGGPSAPSSSTGLASCCGGTWRGRGPSSTRACAGTAPTRPPGATLAMAPAAVRSIATG